MDIVSCADIDKLKNTVGELVTEEEEFRSGGVVGKIKYNKHGFVKEIKNQYGKIISKVRIQDIIYTKNKDVYTSSLDGSYLTKENAKLIQIMKSGGIANQYEGLTSEEVWSKWTDKQKTEFLVDHASEFKDAFENFKGGDDSNYTTWGSIARGIKSHDELPVVVKNSLRIHVKDGQYKKAGKVEDERAKEIANEERAKNIVKNEIFANQNSLVEKLISNETIPIDDIQNYYAPAEEGSDEEEQPQDIMEWWLVSDWLKDALLKKGEPIIDNELGKWWGRTTSGQAIYMDGVIKNIASVGHFKSGGKTEDEKGYNGWKNYETWNVKLWMDEEGSYWNERATEIAKEAKKDKILSKKDNAKYTLSKELKSYHEENNPLADQANTYTDLLGAALQEVDWYEIAGSLLEEIMKFGGSTPKDTGKIKSSIKDIKKIERYVDFSIRGNSNEIPSSDEDLYQMINDYSVYLSDKEFLEKWYDKKKMTGMHTDEEFEENGNMEEFRVTEAYYITFKDDSEIAVDFAVPDGDFIGADSRDAEKGSMAEKWLPEYDTRGGWDMDIDSLEEAVSGKKSSGGSMAKEGGVMGVDRRTEVKKSDSSPNKWIFKITWADLIDGNKVWRKYPNYISELFDTKHEAEEELEKQLIRSEELARMSPSGSNLGKASSGGSMKSGGEAGREFEYLRLVPHKNGLEIFLTKEGKEKVKEDGITFANAWEYFEDIEGNSEYKYHVSMGDSGFGMTEAEGITDGYEPSEDVAGEWETRFPESAKVYWFPNYMIKFWGDILKDEGVVFFNSADQKKQGGRADVTKNYYRFHQRSPKNVTECATPQWAQKVAETIKKGAKVTSCKSDGKWKIKSIIIPKQGVSSSEASRMANEIKSKFSVKKKALGGVAETCTCDDIATTIEGLETLRDTTEDDGEKKRYSELIDALN